MTCSLKTRIHYTILMSNVAIYTLVVNCQNNFYMCVLLQSSSHMSVSYSGSSVSLGSLCSYTSIISERFMPASTSSTFISHFLGKQTLLNSSNRSILISINAIMISPRNSPRAPP